MKTRIGLVISAGLGLAITSEVRGAEPAMRVVRTGGPEREALRNGDSNRRQGQN